MSLKQSRFLFSCIFLEYNGQHLDLEINNELSYLTATIAKALSLSGGNTLLIGKDGIGRRSALKIVSTILSSRIITVESGEQLAFNNTLKTVSSNCKIFLC